MQSFRVVRVCVYVQFKVGCSHTLLAHYIRVYGFEFYFHRARVYSPALRWLRRINKLAARVFTRARARQTNKNRHEDMDGVDNGRELSTRGHTS